MATVHSATSILDAALGSSLRRYNYPPDVGSGPRLCGWAIRAQRRWIDPALELGREEALRPPVARTQP